MGAGPVDNAAEQPRLNTTNSATRAQELSKGNFVAEIKERAQSNSIIATMIIVSLVVSSVLVPVGAILAIIYYVLEITKHFN